MENKNEAKQRNRSQTKTPKRSATNRRKDVQQVANKLCK